jgi:hypothetical protein
MLSTLHDKRRPLTLRMLALDGQHKAFLNLQQWRPFSYAMSGFRYSDPSGMSLVSAVAHGWTHHKLDGDGPDHIDVRFSMLISWIMDVFIFFKILYVCCNSTVMS